MLILNDDYVICPVCNKCYKEINKSHLKLHNLDIKTFDILYPNNLRLSKKVLDKKNHFKNLTTEMSVKLKFSHTLDGYKQKYGEVEGEKKWVEHNKNKKFYQTKEGYIQKYGEVEGEEKWVEHNKNKNFTLEKCIKKHGEQLGKETYTKETNRKIKQNTLDYYIETYGQEDGVEKWYNKNINISKSNSLVPVEKRESYKKYCYEVQKITNISIKMFSHKNIDLLKLGNYEKDHKVSKFYGFNNNIPSYIIGSIYNIDIITCSENCSKQENCSMEIEDLTYLTMNDLFYKELKNIYEKEDILYDENVIRKMNNILKYISKLYTI